nr:hypothetical protein [Tanacetum cinerariifolium]
MGEPLSPDRVFDFPMDEPKPHPAYDFFASGSLPGYAGNPNNNNRWIEADADEQMAGPMIGKIAEPIMEMEEQMIAPVIDAKKDIAMLLRAGISIGEISLRVFAVEGQVQVTASQMFHVADRFEQIGAQME